MTEVDTLLDDIKLSRKIASGGMAEVWEAFQTGVEGFEKRLAVKVILPHLNENEEFVRMFLDEGRLAAQLNHPNICQIYKLGQANQTYYMAMEFIDGVVLNNLIKQAIKRDVLIPFEHCCQIVMGACAGLEYAHALTDLDNRALNIVHRDISPPNIMLSRDGNVKVVDFGVAKAATQLHHTRTGMLKGKYAYMSPEQIDDMPVDRRTDLFALGVVLWELTTGHRLFFGDSEASTFKKIISDGYEAPSLYRAPFPKELERIIMRSISFEREERYADCGELLEDLENFLFSEGLVARPRRLARYVRWLMEDGEAEESAPNELTWTEKRQITERTPLKRRTKEPTPLAVTPLSAKLTVPNDPTSARPSTFLEPEKEELHRPKRFGVEPTLGGGHSPFEPARELHTGPDHWKPDPAVSAKNIANSKKNARNQCILLVDDQQEILDAVSFIFRAAGFDVVQAHDGLEAIERVREDSYDLCVLDLDMPRLDGRGALRQIRQLRPSLPCIIQTANHSFQEAVKLGRLGAVTYLAKPAKRRVLLQAVEDALQFRPDKEDLERSILTEYPTPLSEVLYRFRKAPERETTAKIRHGLLAAQFEVFCAWLGTLSIAAYVADRTFDPALNQALRHHAKRLGPGAWIELIASVGDVYRENDKTFLSRELRDLFAPGSWLDEDGVLLLNQLTDVIAPLVGFEEPKTLSPTETMQILADYYEDLWRDDSLLKDRDVERAVSVLEPLMNSLYQRIYRLIDFDLVRVDSVEMTREGVRHDLTVLRGLNPERSTFMARTRLENHSLYLFDRLGQVLFPLSPFVLSIESSDENPHPHGIAFPVRLDPERRMLFRNVTSGHLHRPDDDIRTHTQQLFERLLTPEERTQHFQREITVLFTDLQGSTQFYETHGDVAGRLLVHTHDNLLFPVIERNHGWVVKTIGDAIMAVFEKPIFAVQAGIDMQHTLKTHNAKPSTVHPILIRIGLHTGLGIVEPHDVYGDVVNTAARVQDQARAQQVLISETLHNAISSSASTSTFFLQPAGEAHLKGKEKPVRLFLVCWEDD